MTPSSAIAYRWSARLGSLLSVGLMICGLMTNSFGAKDIGNQILTWAIYTLFLTPLAGLAFLLWAAIQAQDRRQIVLIIGLCIILAGGLWAITYR